MRKFLIFVSFACSVLFFVNCSKPPRNSYFVVRNNGDTLRIEAYGCDVEMDTVCNDVLTRARFDCGDFRYILNDIDTIMIK